MRLKYLIKAVFWWVFANVFPDFCGYEWCHTEFKIHIPFSVIERALAKRISGGLLKILWFPISPARSLVRKNKPPSPGATTCSPSQCENFFSTSVEFESHYTSQWLLSWLLKNGYVGRTYVAGTEDYKYILIIFERRYSSTLLSFS